MSDDESNQNSFGILPPVDSNAAQTEPWIIRALSGQAAVTGGGLA